MLRLDPIALARRQLVRDENATRTQPLFAHKLERMSASPLAFLRGTAPMFYEILRECPDLAAGPAGVGWIAGDLHLENFGAFRPRAIPDDDRPSKRKQGAPLVEFQMNDFDDAVVGPWRFDVLRLMVSLLLGGRELRVRGAHGVELCEALLDAYVGVAMGRATLPRAPRPVAELVERVATRTRAQLLAGRTKLSHGKRAFVRGDHFLDLSKGVDRAARAAFQRYASRVAEREKISKEHFEILDVAFRIAGTGSLGSTRVGVLVRGKGGPEGAWIFDMKEEGLPSAARELGIPARASAKRVVTALQECLTHPPQMIGTTKLGERSMIVRRLAPQEDKLDLTTVDLRDLEPLAAYLGALTGTSHRRGASKPSKRPWKKKETTQLLDHAIAMAGIHEAAYLAYFKLSR
jgi:uncharacterized protein (DUF2252 family)